MCAGQIERIQIGICVPGFKLKSIDILLKKKTTNSPGKTQIVTITTKIERDRNRERKIDNCESVLGVRVYTQTQPNIMYIYFVRHRQTNNYCSVSHLNLQIVDSERKQ